jgi:hypothetical protein
MKGRTTAYTISEALDALKTRGVGEAQRTDYTIVSKAAVSIQLLLESKVSLIG